MSKILRFSLVAFVLVAMSAVTMAQSNTTGAIGGVVTNPNKEVVPGATVTVRNVETNQESTVTTDDQGSFRVVQLPPGNYSVRVTATGFGDFTQDKVVVEVGRVTPLDVPLAVGQVTGAVEVTGEAPVVNTSQQDFSTNINQTSINELPINGRRWSNFALLTPGAVPDGDFGFISFRGISGLLNNNTVDGGDNNQAFYSEERGRTRIGYSYSQAQVREFQVNTSNYSAEYGRAAGGVVNAVSKSGTNEYHGQLFYYRRDNKLGARNPLGFNTVLIAPGVTDRVALKPVDLRHQFGGNIGGYIVKNKLFWFFNYDEQRRNFPGIAQASTANFFNSLTTANRTTLTSSAVGLTNAQIDAGIAFLVSLTGEVPRKQNQRIFFPKVDWNINQNNTFSASINVLRADSPAGIQTQPTVTRGRASFGDDFVDSETFISRLTSTISPTVLNEARFLYSRDFEYAFSQTPLPGEPIGAGQTRPPQIGISGGITFGKPQFLERYANPLEKRYQFADTITVSRGNHTFKFGGDINHVNDFQSNLFSESGTYFYSSLSDFLVDYTNFTTGGALRSAGKRCNTTSTAALAGQCYSGNPGFQQGFGPRETQFTTTDYNFFVQDDWRMSPRLTVNLGLRYEYQRLPNGASTPIPQPDVVNGQTLTPRPAPFPDDKNNWGPRFGFAYDITGDAKTSVRGGFGVYYGRLQGHLISSAINGTGAPDRQLQAIFSNGSTAGAPVFPNLLPSAANLGALSLAYYAPNTANPLIYQYDLILEREIAQNTVVSVSYVGSMGRYLPSFIDVNLKYPTNTRTFTFVGGPLDGRTLNYPNFPSGAANARITTAYSAIVEMGSRVKSQYDAFIVQANRRLTKGLQFQTSYTFSRSVDTGQRPSSSTFAPTNSVQLNPYNLGGDLGYSNLNIPHRFVASIVYTPNHYFGMGNSAVGRAIFGGWTFAPVIQIQSGRPYSAETSGTTGLSTTVTGAGSTNNYIPELGRNTFKQPMIWNVDFRISRRFRFSEKKNLEVLAEGFNIFNRTQVTAVNNTAYRLQSGTSQFNFDPTFGSIQTTGNSLYRERQIQLAVRFEF